MEQFFDKYLKTVLDTETILYTGTVTAIKGLMIRSRGPYAKIGELCTIKNADGTELVAEVVGFDQEENAVNLMAYLLGCGEYRSTLRIASAEYHLCSVIIHSLNN